MRSRVGIGATVATMVLGSVIVRSMFQGPAVRSVDEKFLREYAGVYQWSPNAFGYLQMWEEFSGFGKPNLAAFDESGEVRTLYPTDRDQFFAGPGVADPASLESRIEFQRGTTGNITSLTWAREGTPARTARRVDIERREDVRFSNGDVQLAGTLISPSIPGPHPAVILVHASGAENREHLLPFARFLIRHGMAVLGYDKRGVGGSTGDWNKASFRRPRRRRRCRLRISEDPQGYPARADRHVGVEPSRLDNATGRYTREGFGIFDQHLGRGSIGLGDDHRPGTKRDGRQWHATADDRSDRRAHEAAVRVTYAPVKDGTSTWRCVNGSSLGWAEIRHRHSRQPRIIPTCNSFDH